MAGVGGAAGGDDRPGSCRRDHPALLRLALPAAGAGQAGRGRVGVGVGVRVGGCAAHVAPGAGRGRGCALRSRSGASALPHAPPARARRRVAWGRSVPPKRPPMCSRRRRWVALRALHALHALHPLHTAFPAPAQAKALLRECRENKLFLDKETEAGAYNSLLWHCNQIGSQVGRASCLCGAGRRPGFRM